MIDWNCAWFARNAASASCALAHRDRELFRLRADAPVGLGAREDFAHDHAPGEDQQNAETGHDARRDAACSHHGARISLSASDTATSSGGLATGR